MSDKCPGCKAEALPASEWDARMERTVFACRSQRLGGYFDESKQCLRNQLAERTAERDALKRAVNDADLLLGNAWQNVVDLAYGVGVEAALRAQIAKLTGDVLELTAERDALLAAARKGGDG